MGALHLLHTWGLSNSSEKISFTSPQAGHLQEKDSMFLRLENPGQCDGKLPFSVIGFLLI
jgi:hypothetical protein